MSLTLVTLLVFIINKVVFYNYLENKQTYIFYSYYITFLLEHRYMYQQIKDCKSPRKYIFTTFRAFLAGVLQSVAIDDSFNYSGLRWNLFRFFVLFVLVELIPDRLFNVYYTKNRSMRLICVLENNFFFVTAYFQVLQTLYGFYGYTWKIFLQLLLIEGTCFGQIRFIEDFFYEKSVGIKAQVEVTATYILCFMMHYFVPESYSVSGAFTIVRSVPINLIVMTILLGAAYRSLDFIQNPHHIPLTEDLEQVQNKDNEKVKKD